MTCIRKKVPIFDVIILIIMTTVFLILVIVENNVIMSLVFALVSWTLFIIVSLNTIALRIMINERTDYINMLYDSGMVK